ncbi:MAG: hypothetical protein ACLTYW_07395 [Collinsella sp.]
MTRDVLERIESPEMRLALMELDRENASTWAMACRRDRLRAHRCPSAVVAMPNPMLAPVRARARAVAGKGPR